MVIDGKGIRDKEIEKLKEIISNIEDRLKLVVIQVGEDTASSIYVSQKKKMAEYVGISFEHLKLDSKIKEQELLNIIDKLNNDDTVTGILVQLPLPKQINANKVVNSIVYYKDVDGLSNINAGRLVHNEKCLISCTPKGIMKLLDTYNIDVASKNVVIVGRSNLVGKPLANLLLNKDATVTITHSKTNNLEYFTKNADVLIVAVGIPKFIKDNMIKDNAVVIDVGINRLEDKIVGDVDFDTIKDKASYITPVPKGVGPMTVLELGFNIVEAYKIKESK